MAECVYLVDDDPGVLKALTRVLRSAGLQAVPFASAQEFATRRDAAMRGCLVLDVAMPGLDGLELQQSLAAQGSTLPIIFLSGHSDIATSVRAIKRGAVDFLTKPVNEQHLLSAVREALTQDAAQAARSAERLALSERMAKLTPRESQVLGHVVAGKLNKEIATLLGTAEKTVKVHRGRVMQKMQAQSLADLVRMVERAR